MPAKALVPIFKVCPKTVVKAPLTVTGFNTVTVFEAVVFILKLLSRFVVPKVVWSKLNDGLTAPLMVRLLEALPFNPPDVVFVMVPLIVNVFALISILPPLIVKSLVTVVAPDKDVFPKTAKFSAVPLKLAKFVEGLATITISSKPNSSKSVLPETAAPVHLK